MIHHLSFGTNDLDRARAFYDPVLAVIGLRLMNADAQSLDYGAGTWLFSLERPLDGSPATAGNGAHVAFAVETRDMVAAFHRAGLAHGGRDAGPPGVRPEYDAHYYAAFLFDPDGNKIEAVTFSAK
ncbi:VOC family protein [Aquabacter spiritensis]|uniref:Catechol 2,3-dioxygenase-like lactoylglutathione lyase family enzyme n=1 Tax=Aquabacter spiritensis TaxID=933073 RepID=A0A4R3LZV1_9HYPH|nr:VOC family protein [Aquabacter spiritensis]TCT06260.1 catechol 2,3-dioxygenase-like lactoylglutathione lyase family enzyme [Aquabacter spiritensis]